MCLRNIASQLKRVHRCSEKVDDVLMFSGGVDRLQSGSITAAELRRLLHCCGFHLQDDAFSALLEGLVLHVPITNITMHACYSVYYTNGRIYCTV